MNKSHHPKLVARGNEAEDAGLKFKGAPADDCDPFAIQNYIDRLAAEVYDSYYPPKEFDKTPDKDEWELMKEKAKSVPFQDVTLSIALKHGLLDEVKKENASKSFEKDSILTILKVRDDFLHEYADANGFEYQWQIWVEWERYLKQIGVTIPQWGKIARKLIRLGVQRIQEDMTKKYAQISSNKRKPQSAEEVPQTQEGRRRRVTLPSDTPAPFAGSPGFGSFSAPSMARSSSFGGIMDAPFSTTTSMFASNPSTPYSSTPSTPYSSAPSTPIYSAPSTPTPNEPFSPMQSPVITSPPFPNIRPASFENSPHAPAFGASLYNMIHTATPSNPNIFANVAPMRSPSISNAPSPAHAPQPIDISQSPSFAHNFTSHFSNAASLPYPYDHQQQGFMAAHTPMQTYAPVIQSPSYPVPMQYTPPPPPSTIYSPAPATPTYMVTSPSIASPPHFSTPAPSTMPSFMAMPPQFH